MLALIQQRPIKADLPADSVFSPLAGHVLQRRPNLTPAATLHLEQLLLPTAMKGIDDAVDLLLDAIAAQKLILVVGDYDADGATATALMVRCLRNDFGAQVDFFIPSRFTMGYGLGITAVEAITQQFQPLPQLLITVDNGIASHDGIVLAQQRGMQVLVTDHHLPGRLPCPADAVVNPNQPGCLFPSKSICGCGVAFYVLMRLRQRASSWLTHQQLAQPNLAQYLDWVALATVADLVALDHNNRILVEQGLRRLRAGQGSLGIMALLALSGRQFKRLQSQDLGFALAPRLNAAGRMEEMSLGVHCLLADTPELAALLAAQLDRCNQQRRHRQAEMLQQAALKVGSIVKKPLPSSLPDQQIRVLWDTDWHEGIVGLIAGQLKERLQQPVIALGRGQDGLYKGSARSIPGVHIRDLLAWVDAQYPHLLVRFGGHAMAAGLTIEGSQLTTFEQALAAAAKHCVRPEQWQSVQWVDGALTPHLLTLVEAEHLEMLGPWGQGCPVPAFVNTFQVRSQQWLKGAHLRLTLSLSGSEQTWSAIWFYCPLDVTTPLHDWVTLVYELNINSFRGVDQLQLLIRNQVILETHLVQTILDHPLH